MQDSYSGLQDNIRDLETPKIETWKNEYPDRIVPIEIETSELTAICPKTGLPDFGHITIQYDPYKSCLELKSLKEYFLFYRDVGIFHEHLVSKILDDIVKACEPRQAMVKIIMKPRGGITTTVSARYTYLGKENSFWKEIQ